MLDFKHTIQIEIHNDAYPSVVKFFINNDLKHEKIYDPGTHNDSISFNHLYTNGNKNKLLLSYNAKAETEAKHIKIKNIIINSTNLNLLNATYKPELNQDWWDSLDESKKEYYKDVIYSTSSNTFGWYGDISYYYYTVVDKASKTKTRSAVGYDNIDDIVGKKIEWICK